MQEAIQRALEENPHLAEELGLDNKYVKKASTKHVSAKYMYSNGCGSQCMF